MDQLHIDRRHVSAAVIAAADAPRVHRGEALRLGASEHMDVVAQQAAGTAAVSVEAPVADNARAPDYVGRELFPSMCT
jgi:hypothetical protein